MALDLDTCAELGALRGSAQPAFVWSLNGRALLWANDAAAAFWGVRSRSALMARDWANAPSHPVLANIANALGPHAMRLERLRLLPPGRTAPLVVQAHRITLPDGQRGLLTLGLEHMPAQRLARIIEEAPAAAEPAQAAPAPALPASVSSMWARASNFAPLRPAPGSAPVPQPASAPEQASLPLETSVAPEPAPLPAESGIEAAISEDAIEDAPEAFIEAVADAAVETPPAPVTDLPVHSPILPELVPAPGKALDERAADIAARDKPLRFVWQTNWRGELVHISPEFVRLVGSAAMPDADESLGTFVANACIDPDEQLETALGSGLSWDGIGVQWPISGSMYHAIVELSAIAQHDEAGDFEGFKGLGALNGTTAPAQAIASHLSAAANAADPDDAPAPAPVAASVDDTFLAIRQALSGVMLTEPAGETAPPDRGNVVPLRSPAAAESGHEARHDRINDQGALALSAPAFAAPQTIDNAALIARLRDAERREAELRAVLDTATDGVIMLRGDGSIDSLNHPAEALFGIDQREVTGQPITRLLAPQSHRAAEDYLAGLMANGVASVLNDGREVLGLERKGGHIPLFMTIGRLGFEGSSKMCAVLRDISQWKKAEETLTGAKKEAELASSHKSDFLAKISHEIRTPLNAIIGFSEVMMEEHFGPVGNDRYKGYLKDIHTSGTHLVSLVNDLLDLSKIEAGKMDLSPTSVSLSDMVMQAVAIMQPQANRDGVILRTSLPRTPAVVADQRSVRQILLNLLSNAIRFSKAGGQVILSTSVTAEGEVSLKIRDHGIGMSEKDIAIAMEPFRQVSALGRASSGGTGLGLPLTKALAEANRARFSIESESGAGTMVQILFPATRVLAE